MKYIQNSSHTLGIKEERCNAMSEPNDTELIPICFPATTGRLLNHSTAS